jgi:putative SOS response-associated peptidase YedK
VCNRARGKFEPETLREKFGAKWGPQIPNTSTIELVAARQGAGDPVCRTQRIIDLMQWDVLGGQAPWPMTNVRNLGLPQWKRWPRSPRTAASCR